ncbi:hypothetical protein [Candidatus Viridilinea mediisalina]|uniref:Glycosyltransferase RgtA/B/C/D-like domain-containing protein n=1 Tax=Candidatus Viridilinea mediisalina TaxID=2024553 RepID=A0A2A6RNG1_9CHLR|nr:hypothetical protein [Candidatus Viridilinea mediisalina]PDW04390.1 hypothetical protein CJ255_03755 [Candidatus Viridilinea mediisalina]
MRVTIADRFAGVWIVVVSVVLFVLFRDYGFDDPYITYRYAFNLAEGQGFVYNPGEQVLSTTAPLYAMILACMHLIGIEIPLASNLLSACSMGFGALALYALARLAQKHVAAIVAIILYPLTPYLTATFGGEMLMVIALGLWAMVALAMNRPYSAGVLVACATLMRADAALAAALIGLVFLYQRQYASFLRFSLVYLLTITPFVVAAWLYFGSPIPVTLGTKQSQADIFGSRSFFSGLDVILSIFIYNIFFLPFLVFFLFRLPHLLHRSNLLLVALAWGVLHTIAYSLLGVTNYFWYYVPTILAIIVATALGAQALYQVVGQQFGKRITRPFLASLVLALCISQIMGLAQRTVTPDLRLEAYRNVGLWLQQHTAPDARVAMLEVGIIGFYSQRYIIDFAGLIQPDVATIFGPDSGYLEAAHWALAHYRPNYLVTQESGLPVLQHNPELMSICSQVAAFPEPRFPTPMTIHRCTW